MAFSLLDLKDKLGQVLNGVSKQIPQTANTYVNTYKKVSPYVPFAPQMPSNKPSPIVNNVVKPILTSTYNSAKPIIDYVDPRGYAAERANPGLGNKKLTKAIQAMPGTALNLYGLSKLTPASTLFSAVFGGALSKITGGSFTAGARSGLESAPMISAISSFTNPLIQMGTNTVASKLTNPLAQQITGRIASGIGNIPEGYVMGKGLGRKNYGGTDAALDFLTGAAFQPPSGGIRVKGAMGRTPTYLDPEDAGYYYRAQDILKDRKSTSDQIKQAKNVVFNLAERYLSPQERPSSGGVKQIIKALEDKANNSNVNYGDSPFIMGIDQKKQRGFSTSVGESTNVSGQAKKTTSSFYTQKPNDVLMGEAQALLQDGASIDVKNVKNVDQKVAATIQEALNQDKAGNHDAAANLYNNLSRQGTELGRGVQAFSMLDKMSPEAITRTAARTIQKYNETATRKIPELSGTQQKMISDAVAGIQNLPKGRERNIAINELQNTINSFIPSSITDKAVTVWKAGLLTSLRTHERNLLGNTIMQGAEILKDPFATIADKAMSLRTGQRTQTSTLQGLSDFGSKETRQQIADGLKLGYDPSNDISKFEIKRINWGANPVEQALKKYTDAVFRTLSVEDKPFYNAAFARSLYDQAGAISINTGQPVAQIMKKPTEQMLTTAAVDANTATFKDKNAISSLAGSIKRWADETWYKKLPVEVIAPFTGVPSSIVGKTVAYSPIGLIKGAINAGRVTMGNMPELQRQAAQEIGRGVVGTGLFGLGAYLMQKGLMTGQPKDSKEADLWATQGKQANSVLIDGKWRSINSIGPQNIMILAGAKYQEEMNKPNPDMANYAFGLGKDQLSQTFLAGVQGPLNAITDPARYGKSYVGNQSASIIPNIVKDAAKAGDKSVRENNTILDYLKSGIPGIRNTMVPKRDVLGNIIPQEPTGINAFFDLFNSKTPIENATVSELSRLAQTGNEATPSKLTTNQTILKQKVKLTFEQLNNLEAGVGEALKPQLESLISSPVYKQLDDEKKAKAVDNLVKDVRLKYKNINATDILSGKSATGFPQINTTVSQSAQAPSNPQGKIYSYIDEQGNYKTVDMTKAITKPELSGISALDDKLNSKYKSEITSRQKDVITLYDNGQLSKSQAAKMLSDLQDQSIDISKPIEKPKLTGDAVLDKKLIAQYRSEITARQNDIVDLYQSGKLSQAEASNLLTGLQNQSNSYKAAKKPKRITIAKVSVPKYTSRKFKLATPKIAAPPKIKIAKMSKVKAIKLRAARKITLKKS